MKRKLAIQGLEAGIEGKRILEGVDLEIGTGEIHALMGPNGSGKSTLANVLMGHPSYEVTGGKVSLDGEDYLGLSTTERALRGVYLAFQYPVEIPGVTVGRFIKRAVELRAPKAGLNVSAYIKRLREAMDFMEMDQAFINRYLNQGFSGGEKKRMEVLQMLMLDPSFAILDETDSGLDIDALKVVAKGVNRLRDSSRAGEGFGALIITHYRRILEQIEPDHVHIMYKGRIVTSGGKELVEELEKKGYDWVKEAYGADEAAGLHAPALASGART
jgi:Fe-S cluster assembly ATP-binding protein